MIEPSLREESASNLRRLDGRRGLELAAVGQKFYKASQNLVVSPRPHVLLQRLFERRARPSLVRLEDGGQIFGRAHVLLIVRLDVTRLYLVAALPTQR